MNKTLTFEFTIPEDPAITSDQIVNRSWKQDNETNTKTREVRVKAPNFKAALEIFSNKYDLNLVTCIYRTQDDETETLG